MSDIYANMPAVETMTYQAFVEQKVTLADFVKPLTKPLVIKGLVRDWPITQLSSQQENGNEDTIDYLLSHYQGLAVGTGACPPEYAGRLFYTSDFSAVNFERKTSDLRAFFNELQSTWHNDKPAGCYLGSTNVDQLVPGFRANNNLDGLNELNPLMSIWISNQTTVAAHHDVPNNVACCVAGKRRFTLFPPEQVANLYIGPLEHTPAGQAISLVDFANPDFEQFPKFAQALETAQIAELEAGDALFLPSMWWHQVESLTTFNILINYWWQCSPLYMGAPIDAMFHALLNIRSLPKSERKAWQAMFEHYVFNQDDTAFEHIPEAQRGVLDGSDISARRIRSVLLNKLNR